MTKEVDLRLSLTLSLSLKSQNCFYCINSRFLLGFDRLWSLKLGAWNCNERNHLEPWTWWLGDLRNQWIYDLGILAKTPKFLF